MIMCFRSGTGKANDAAGLSAIEDVSAALC
jgi:hypothetical protein